MSYDNLKCEYNQPEEYAATSVEVNIPSQQTANRPAVSYQPPQYSYFNQSPTAVTTSPVPVMMSPMQGMTSPVQGMTVFEPTPKWSWNVTITSLLTMVFCFFGGCFWAFVGLVQAIHAYVDHKAGHYAHSRHKKKCAWGFTITGIVLGSVFWISLIVSIYLLFETWMTMVRETAYNNDNDV